jgi:hypothetical protein
MNVLNLALTSVRNCQGFAQVAPRSFFERLRRSSENSVEICVRKAHTNLNTIFRRGSHVSQRQHKDDLCEDLAKLWGIIGLAPVMHGLSEGMPGPLALAQYAHGRAQLSLTAL